MVYDTWFAAAARTLEDAFGGTMSTARITWTKIDEAPALATYALLPIVRA